MKVIMNDNAEYDFTLKDFNIEFPLDEYHSPAELPSTIMIQNICNGKIEMKDSELTLKYGNLFVEYKHKDFEGDKWKKSGLQLTKSDYWFFKIGFGGFFIETKFLNFCYMKRDELNIKSIPNNNPNYGIGMALIIPMGRLPQLMQKYKEYLNLK